MAFDWSRAWRVGEDLAREQIRKGDPLDERAILWALLREAATTSRLAYKGPPFSGWPSKSSMPDAPDDITIWQKVAAYLRGEVEEMPVEEETPPRPSSEQITRCKYVLHLYHHNALIERGDFARCRRAVWLKACGVPDRKVRALTGFTRSQIKYQKQQALDGMYDALRAQESFLQCA